MVQPVMSEWSDCTFLILLSQCQKPMGFFDCVIQLLKIKTNYKITPPGNKGQKVHFLSFIPNYDSLVPSSNPTAEAAGEWSTSPWKHQEQHEIHERSSFLHLWSRHTHSRWWPRKTRRKAQTAANCKCLKSTCWRISHCNWRKQRSTWQGVSLLSICLQKINEKHKCWRYSTTPPVRNKCVPHFIVSFG